jgi:hypothetical protein
VKRRDIERTLSADRAIASAHFPAFLLLAIALSFLTTPDAAGQRAVASCAGIQILSQDISGREAETYCRYAEAERKKVSDFWGATWNEPIRIHVDRSYKISRALVPGYRGNRGFMEMPTRGVLRNDGALLAGFFVGFLVEKYGLPEFRKLYESGKYEAAYGKTLEALEQEWRSALRDNAR